MRQDNGQRETVGSDAMDAMIVQGLGRRQDKVNRMAEMERAMNRRSIRMWQAVVPLAAAACVAAIFVWFQTPADNVTPWDELGLSRPALTAYRTATVGSDDIDKLVETGDYGQALAKTAEALKASDKRVEAAAEAVAACAEDQSLVYALQSERSFASELRWTYIYLLVKTGDHQAAMAEIRRYIHEARHAECMEHAEDAGKLLEKLEKK